MPPCAAKGETMMKHDEPKWTAADLSAEERLRHAIAEIARLRRKMDTATPWGVSDPPTDEDMRALRLRWANGPERYQADADALIAAVIHGRSELDALRALLAAEREKTEHSVPMASILAARDLFEMGSAGYEAIDDIIAGKWGIGQ